MSNHFSQLMNGHAWYPRPSYSHHHLQMEQVKQRDQETMDEYCRYFRDSRLQTLGASQNISGHQPFWPYYLADQRSVPSPVFNTNTNFNPSRLMDQYAPINISPTCSMTATSLSPDATTTAAPTPSLTSGTVPSCKRKQKRYRSLHQDSFEKSTKNKDRRDSPAVRTSSGLRNFSRMVMEKVREKKNTSFDEIADEMFAELNKPGNDATMGNKECIIKSIRRRVYDILNVLVAMEMVLKDKKKITWIEQVQSDIPDEQQTLQKEKQELEESIKQKNADMQQLVLQQVAYKNILESKKDSNPQQCALAARKTIHLPFIIVRTSKNTVITHATSKDNLDHVFNFDQPFQIHDNMEVLMRMGMAFGLETNTCSQKNLEISRTMVSKELHPYLEEMHTFGPIPKTGSKFRK